MNLKLILRRFFHKPVAMVRNDGGERIESLRFTVPALRVGVLEYAPGQLTTNNKKLDGKIVKLYYPPEAVSAEKFLKSLQSAPVVVGGHESTTNEHNKKIDGWAHTVSYDSIAQAAMISGIVKGNKEVAFIKGNIKTKDFGASAFVDIFDMEIKNGVTPDGQEYNAIAKELIATHVALAAHVRDPQNKIRITNAVVINTGGNYEYSEEKSMAELNAEQITALVKNAVTEVLSALNAESEIKELKEKIKSLEALNCGKGKNAETDEEKKKKEDEKEAKNAEEDDKEKKEKEEKEDKTLENAKPAQALIAAVGTALNIDFGTKTPSFAILAEMLGIKEGDPAARIIAVNAKYKELAVEKPTEKNSDVEVF